MSVPANTASTSRSGPLTAADWGLLFLRIALGIVFIAHGAQKVFGWFGGPGLAGTIGFMHGKLGIPVPLAYLASFTEFFGGLAVLFGFLGRLAALGLSINMLVAIFTVHLPNGFFLGKKEGFEYAFALLGMALCVLFAGPGRIALADFEPRWFGKRRAA